MECYTTGPTTPNNNSTFYDNNNYGDQQLRWFSVGICKY